ncbi:Neuronal acetylcholine receptor subunit alpha-7 [Mactra antiquata]
MYTLAEMNVADESVCVFGSIEMTWIDAMLRWNDTYYGGIRKVLAPHGLYWRPHISFDTNPSACDGRQSKVIERVLLYSDGTINLIFHGYIGTSCIVDVKLFPFDRHVCAYRYFDFSHDTTEFILHSQDKTVQYDMFHLNEEWEVSDIGSSLFIVPFSGNESWTGVYECNFKVSRRPGFIVIHNIIPAGFVILLSLFVPFIPPDTGEILSYAITTYLATVFISVSFYENIPNSSLCITLMSYNLVTYYAISSLTLIWSIGIVCLSRQSTKQKKIPKYIIKRLVKTSENTSEIKSADDYAIVKEDGNKVDYNSDMSKVEWYDVSRYLDKLFFILTLVIYLCLLGWNIFMATNKTFNACQSTVIA